LTGRSSAGLVRLGVGDVTIRETSIPSSSFPSNTVRADDALPAKDRVGLNGVDLAYLVHGPSAGPTVLWIHGFPRNAYVWRGCLDTIAAAGFRCLAPDLPGMGESEAPQAAEFGPVAQADVLAALLDHVGADRVRVVAEGTGALASLALATLRRGAVRGLALLDPDLLRQPGSPLRLAGAAARSGYGDLILGSLRAKRLFSRLDLGSRRSGGRLSRTGDLYLRPILAEPQSRARALAFLSALSPGAGADVYRDFLAAPPPPVLVCLGPAGPEETYEDADSDVERLDIPGSHVLRMSDSPGRLLERDPEEILRVVQPFLSALP
jgi:pimeloyl-ACP methyl ester carboxylesterase